MTCELIRKILQIMEKHSDLLDWNEEGKEITILDKARFTREILKKYFRHQRIDSFVRQLNMYGFRKIVKKRNTISFQNPYFIRGQTHNYSLILRKNKNNITNTQPLNQKTSSYHTQIHQNTLLSQNFVLKSLIQYQNRTLHLLKYISDNLNHCVRSESSINPVIQNFIKDIKHAVNQVQNSGVNLDHHRDVSFNQKSSNYQPNYQNQESLTIKNIQNSLKRFDSDFNGDSDRLFDDLLNL